MIIKKIVNSVFFSCTYIIHSELCKNCTIIDCGDIDPITKYINENGLEVEKIFLTHTHFDHIYGINRLFDIFPKIVVYTSKYGGEALHSEKKNLSKYHGQSIVYKGNSVVILSDSDSLELFENCTLTAYETPGHCPSCLVYTLEDFIFTGDSFIPGIEVVTNLPKGNKEIAKSSVEKIKILSQGKKIMAGHSVEKTINKII